jgi:hypothetical protein
MPASSRFITDIWAGICCCHSDPTCIGMAGPIMRGSPNDISGNSNQSRLTDITIGYCGHPGIIVSGASRSLCNNLPKGRIGDTVVGCNIGTLVSGLTIHEIGS